MPYLKKTIDNEVIAEITPVLLQYRPRLKDAVVCDFCGDERPICIYAASEMSTGQQRECWRWCACEKCSSAVDQDDWKTVEERMANRLRKISKANFVNPLPGGLIKYSVKLALQAFHRFAISN